MRYHLNWYSHDTCDIHSQISMAVSPLDPQSARLSITSDMANSLFLHFMVAFIQQLLYIFIAKWVEEERVGKQVCIYYNNFLEL